MKRALAAALSALTLVLVTGCFSGVSGTPGPGEGPASQPAGGGAKAPAPKTEDVEEDDGPAKIGDKYTYSDGVIVEITKVKNTKAGEYAAGAASGDPVTVFTIRIRNKAKSNLDVVAAHATVSYGADGEEAEQVFDANFETFSGTITKGKAKTADLAFAIPKKQRGDVTVEFSPDFEHEAAIFTGSVK